jgi:hypothetical protein
LYVEDIERRIQQLWTHNSHFENRVCGRGGSDGNLQLDTGSAKNAKFIKYLGVVRTENGGSIDEIK